MWVGLILDFKVSKTGIVLIAVERPVRLLEKLPKSLSHFEIDGKNYNLAIMSKIKAQVLIYYLSNIINNYIK